MALDTGIYNALMRPPKSALEYQQEYAQNDLNLEQAAQTRQMNALALQQHQMTLAEAQRAQGEQATLRNALASSGATDMQGRIKAAEGTGTLSGIKQAEEWRKAQAEADQKAADARSKNATAGKSEYDLQRARLEHGIASLTSSPTAAHARAAIAAGVQDGTLDPAQAQRALAEIPDDQAQYQQWRQAKLMGVLSAKDALDAQAPKLQEIRQGDRAALVDVKPTSATYRQEVYSAPINASPDALVLAGTQRGGQIITDARERDLNAAKLEHATKTAAGPKLSTDVQRQITGIVSTDKDIGELRRLLQTFDPRNPADQLDSAKRAQIQSVGKQLQMNLKEAAALGALSGPDMDIVLGMLDDPVGAMAALKGRPALLAKLDAVSAGNLRRFDALRDQYGEAAVPEVYRSKLPQQAGRPATQSPANQPRQAPSGPVAISSEAQYNTLPSGTVYIGPDGKARRKP